MFDTTTDPAHMPEKYAQHQQWKPERLMNWAQALGSEVLILDQGSITA
jgi:hypothetical protein